MDEFFHGWRRKIGIVTLLIACVVTSEWIMSIREKNAIAFSITDTSRTQLISTDATLTLRWFGSKFPVTNVNENFDILLLLVHPLVGKDSGYESVRIDEPTLPMAGNQYHWVLLTGQFKIGSRVAKDFPLRIFVCVIPYWQIVIPLILVSAYLLLVKPRIAKPRVVVENVTLG